MTPHRDRMCMLVAVLVSLAPRSMCFAFSPATRITRSISFKCPAMPSSSLKRPTARILFRRRLPHNGRAASMPPLFADVNDNNDDVAAVSSTNDVNDTSFLTRIKSFFSNKKNSNADGLSTRERLAKLGFAVLLSYGFVSNMSAMLFLSLSWFSFSAKTGLSPLAPGQWKPFTLVYAGFYVVSNLVRPVRITIAVAIGKYFESILNYLQNKTGFSRSVSIAILVFGANVACTLLALVVGVSIASILSGVPIFPSKIAGVA